MEYHSEYCYMEEYHSELAYRIAHGVAHGLNRRHLTIRDVYRDITTLEKAGFFLYTVTSRWSASASTRRRWA